MGTGDVIERGRESEGQDRTFGGGVILSFGSVCRPRMHGTKCVVFVAQENGGDV